MKNIISKFYLFASFLFSTVILFAQPGSTSDDVAPDGLEANDNQAPIGDYLWVLAMVVLVYTFMKFRPVQKNNIQG